MAITSGFFNSVDHDRKYTAEQMSSIFDGLVGDGVYASVGDHFAVKPASGAGMSVSVGSGRAWFNHVWVYNDSPLVLTLAGSDPTLNRIDTIVLEIDSRVSGRTSSIKVLTGSPASSPQRPSPSSSDDLHQYVLAYITVNAGTSTVTQNNIQQWVGMSGTPYVTSIVQTTNLDELWSKWDTQFNTWFKGLEDQLTGDVASKLQSEITALQETVKAIPKKASTSDYNYATDDEKYITSLQTRDIITSLAVAKTDKATTSEMTAATNNTHWVTPALVKSGISNLVHHGSLSVESHDLHSNSALWEKVANMDNVWQLRQSYDSGIVWTPVQWNQNNIVVIEAANNTTAMYMAAYGVVIIPASGAHFTFNKLEDAIYITANKDPSGLKFNWTVYIYTFTKGS